MSSPPRDELDEALDDEASLFGEGDDQGDQGGQGAMEVEEEEDGPVVSLGAFSAAAAAADQARAAAAGRRQRAPSRARGSSSNGPGYSMGEVPSDSENEAERMWRIANTSGGAGEDDASVDGTSVQGDNPGGADLRQVRHPSLTSTETFDTSILCNEDVLAVVFPHSKASNGGWMDYNNIFKRTQADQGTSADDGVADGTAGMIPARAMVFNIPKSAFRPDADRVRDMRSSMTNQSRATNINTLFGLLWTPVAKGWKCVLKLELTAPRRTLQFAATPCIRQFILPTCGPNGTELQQFFIAGECHAEEHVLFSPLREQILLRPATHNIFCVRCVVHRLRNPMSDVPLCCVVGVVPGILHRHPILELA